MAVMPLPIEDYALIGDTKTAALVGRDGSIDWLCAPRFDSDACFAALLGGPEHGRWLLAPKGGVRKVERRYRPGTLVLETDFHTDDGAVRVVDCMPFRELGRLDIVRRVEGLSGSVPMRMELIARFGYGETMPWVRDLDGQLSVVAGPHALYLQSGIETHGENRATVAEFTLPAGEASDFGLVWQASHEPPPPVGLAADAVLASTQELWELWSAASSYEGDWADDVQRSLITLKAMTYSPTGGIVAAVTTSLPEQLGGVRNWDYRFCWLRDATFTLYSLMYAGYRAEASEWRDWLLRAIAGDPHDLQIMYAVDGERRLIESEIDWLPGYEGAKPVRIGNAASDQFQLDVLGEVIDATHQARRVGLPPDRWADDLERGILEWLEDCWEDPDDGIWEVRGPRRHFTHSKVMAWVAFDRAVKASERYGFSGPVEKWRAGRDAARAEVLDKGFNADKNSFTQHYETTELDASLLMIPLVGFLPADDPRMLGTIDAIERELVQDGFVLRYRSQESTDGLPPGEGAFLPCSFWLADNLMLAGRQDDARALFERLRGLKNDVGLYSEEYDPKAKRLIGNFPQAFTHISFVNAARNLSGGGGPAEHRADPSAHSHRPTTSADSPADFPGGAKG